MGDIADMMIDGTMCQGCGEFLHGGYDGHGCPGYCSSCEPRDMQPKSDKPFYVVKNANTLAALPAFIEGVGPVYTSQDQEFDKKGNCLFRLWYDKNPHKDHAFGVSKIGAVVCLRKDMAEKVKDIIDKSWSDWEKKYA